MIWRWGVWAGVPFSISVEGTRKSIQIGPKMFETFSEKYPPSRLPK
jgi:hypothetical protein